MMRSHSKLEHVGRVYVAAAAAAAASRRSFLYSSKTSSHVNSSWSAFWATKTMASKSSGLRLVRRSLSVAFAKLKRRSTAASVNMVLLRRRKTR